MSDQTRFSSSIAISIVLHVMFLMLLALPLLQNAPHLILPTAPIEVSLMPLPKPAPKAPAVPKPAARVPVILPKTQIVNPPDAGKEKPPPKETRYLSDKDISVPVEQVHRGQNGPSGAKSKEPLAFQAKKAKPREAKSAKKPEAPPKQVAEARPKPPHPSARQPAAKQAPEQLASLPPLERLLPNAGDLVREGRLPKPEPEPERKPARGRDLLLSGDNLLHLGAAGTSDFLPNVRAGNITLLNTKADLFAPFVRRVAARVFQNLLIDFSRDTRARSGLRDGRQVVQLEATMDKKGRYVSAHVISKRGNNGLAIDRWLFNAAQPDTFFDANPPAGAEADDGLIHFILIADISVQLAPDPRTGAPFPDAFGLFSVGLR